MCVRQLWCLILSVVLSTMFTADRISRADALFPRPSSDAIAKSEEKVRELYKDELAKAGKPRDKIALAEVLLAAADGVGQDDASRLVLWTMARDLAVDACHAKWALKAVIAITSRFQPDGPTDPKEQVERGNAAWKEAEAAPADKRLRLQIKAAEWYLRARPVVTGLDEILIRKRLDETMTATPLAEPKANVPDDGKSIPTGWVRIVNRKTGKVIHLNARPVRLEPVGEVYKLRSRDGRYVVLAGWAKNGDEGAGRAGLFRYGSDSASSSARWKIEPRGDGSWTITNAQSNKCLEDPNGNPQRFVRDLNLRDPALVVTQSTFREGALEQQWRFEAVKPGE